MLTADRSHDGKRVLATLARKAEAPFFCPTCTKEVVLHKGNIKTHHFKHKPPVTCYRGQGETEAHLRCKLAIFQGLESAANVTDLELEKDLGTSVADVFARINLHPVAIEVQRSNLTVADITQRTENYHQLGIAVLWIGLGNEVLPRDKYSPRAWEKWCHATYFGRVYYWIEGLTLCPVHFDEFKLYVKESSWYEPGGYEETAGGYHKRSKRYKTPRHGAYVNLANDFRPIFKKAFTTKTLVVPPCQIFIDNQSQWWK